MVFRLLSKILMIEPEMAFIDGDLKLSPFDGFVGHVPCVFCKWSIEWCFFVVSDIRRNATQKSLFFLGLTLVSIVPKCCFLRMSIVEIGTESILLSTCNSHISLTKTSISRDETGNGLHFGLILIIFLMSFPCSFRLVKADGHIKDS